ncbi:MAG: hypothetical protein DRP80_03655 [Candidatus Omnitrophota bacterium]|nr:MAG: hypothetical protein DRP69_04535 [Candidatus Omnitrophota bacterium]RKY44002.1 MAG: hypothetical protein DRP80_03655 [Candidatus Omnitrophota bacterium]
MNKKIKLLVLCRENENISELKTLLKKIKSSYKFSTSFSQGLSWLKKDRFRIILVDIDSFSLYPQRIEKFLKRAKAYNPQLLFLIISNPAFLNLARKFLGKGLSFYIKKPIVEQEIKIAVEYLSRFYELAVRNRELKEKLEAFNKKIESFSLIDFLTSCYNYRYLLKRLEEEIKRAQRYLRNISLVSIDIESLVDINEKYGEDIGDLVVVQMANILKKRVRGNDIVCSGGEGRFYIILPDTSKKEAKSFSERIFSYIAGHKFGTKSKNISLRVNIGIAVYPSEGINSPSSFIKASQKALATSKHSHNPITIYSHKLVFKGEIQDVESLQKKLESLNRLVSEGLVDMIHGFAKTIDAKDSYTGRHVEDTAIIAEKIAKKLKLPPQEVENIKHAAILHDLGKVGIEEKILSKKGKLTPKEMKRIKKHPLIAAQILKSVHALSGAVPAILHHHERYDGKGYPYGLKGEEIPLSARIIAVADVYQALISDRPYRKAYSKKEAIEIIKKESGSQFDPKIVKAFLEIVK